MLPVVIVVGPPVGIVLPIVASRGVGTIIAGGANGTSLSRATLKVSACRSLPPCRVGRFATPAHGQSSKDLRLAFINGFSAPQEVFTVDPGNGQGNGAKGNGPPEQITHVSEVLQLRWSPAGNLSAIQTVPFGTIVVMAPDGATRGSSPPTPFSASSRPTVTGWRWCGKPPARTTSGSST